MKNISTAAKFDFKKTTITVFNKQTASQVKHHGDGDTGGSSLPCGTVILTGIFTNISC